MSMERITESGFYLIEHVATHFISRVWITVHETTYLIGEDYQDKSFFHHYYIVREHIPDPYITLGDSPGGEAME